MSAAWRTVATDPPPEDGTEVLVHRPDGGTFIAHFVDDWWFTVCGEDLTGEMFTHWMPLPAPPQEDAT
jgi:hypothetical protein